MATKLFLRNTLANGITDTGDGLCYDLIATAGAASDTGVMDTVGSGTNVQWTKTQGGSTLAWISGRVPSGGFTLTSVDVSAWLEESNTGANAKGRFRIYKYTPGTPTITELGGSPFDDDKVELSTSATEDTWTANVTDTAFAENDRILIRFFITNNGTMGSGRTCTITFNAADAATGDSFVNLAETVAFKAEVRTKALNVTQAQSQTVRRASGKIMAFLQAESLLLRRAVGSRTIVSTPNSASGAAEGHLLVSQTGTPLAQLVSAVGNFVPSGSSTAKVINVAQGQALSLFRAISTSIRVTQAEAISLLRGMATALRIAQSQTVSLLRGSSHGVLVAQTNDASGVAEAHLLIAPQTGTGLAQVITAIENFVAGSSTTQKVITVTQSQAVTLFRGVAHLVALTQAQIVSLFRSAGRIVSSGHGIDASGVAEAHILASQTGTGLAQVITAIENFVAAGGSTTQKAISIVQAQAVTLRRAIAKMMTVGQANDLTGAAEGHILVSSSGAGNGQFVTVTRSFGSIAHVVSSTIGYLLAITLEVHLRGTMGKPLIAQAVTLQKSVGHRIIVALAQVITTSAVRLAPAIQKAINVTQAQTVSLIRAAGKLVSIAGAQAIIVRTALGKIVRVSIAQIVTVFNGSVLTIQKVITVTTAQAITVQRAISRLIALVTMAQTVTLRTSFGKALSVAMGMLVSLRRQIGKIVAVSLDQIISVGRVAAGPMLQVVIAVSQTQAVSVIKSIGKIISAAIGSIASVVARFIELFFPSRIVYVAAEDRTVVVAAEDRVAIVADEQRST